MGLWPVIFVNRIYGLWFVSTVVPKHKPKPSNLIFVPHSLFLPSSSSSSLLVIPGLRMDFFFSLLWMFIYWFGCKHLRCLVPRNKNILLMWNSCCLCLFLLPSPHHHQHSSRYWWWWYWWWRLQFDCYGQHHTMCNGVLWLIGLNDVGRERIRHEEAGAPVSSNSSTCCWKNDSFLFLQAYLAPPSGSTSKKEKRVWMCGPRPPLRRSSGFLVFEADVGEAASRRAGPFNRRGEKFVRTREEDVSDLKERPGGTHSLGAPLVEMIESRNSCRGISSSPSRRTGRHRN